MHSFKDLYRLARRLETAWEKCPDTTDTVFNRITDRIGWLSHDRARLAKAQNAGLKLVLPQLREEIQASLRAIYDAAVEGYTRLDTPIESIVTAAMLVAELQQLEVEFGDLEFDCQGQTSVRRGIATTLALPLIRHRWSIAYVVRHSVLLPEHQQQHQHTQSYLGV